MVRQKKKPPIYFPTSKDCSDQQVNLDPIFFLLPPSSVPLFHCQAAVPLTRTDPVYLEISPRSGALDVFLFSV
jgi:hypothetical protein